MAPDPPFDPDGLYLTKPQLVKLIEAIRNRWRKNKKGNFLLIQAITAFKVSLGLIDDRTIELIFKDIIKAANELAVMNQMERMKGEIPNTEQMVNLITKRIEDGDLFG